MTHRYHLHSDFRTPSTTSPPSPSPTTTITIITTITTSIIPSINNITSIIIINNITSTTTTTIPPPSPPPPSSPPSSPPSPRRPSPRSPPSSPLSGAHCVQISRPSASTVHSKRTLRDGWILGSSIPTYPSETLQATTPWQTQDHVHMLLKRPTWNLKTTTFVDRGLKYPNLSQLLG